MAPQTLRVYAVADIHAPESFIMPELSRDDYDVVLTLGDIEAATIDYILFMGRRIPHHFEDTYAMKDAVPKSTAFGRLASWIKTRGTPSRSTPR